MIDRAKAILFAAFLALISGSTMAQSAEPEDDRMEERARLLMVCMASADPAEADHAAVREQCQDFAEVATQGPYSTRLRVLPRIERDNTHGDDEASYPQQR